MAKIARRVFSVQPASLHTIQLWDELFLLFSFLSLSPGVTRPQTASLKNGKLGGWAGRQVHLHCPLPCVDSHFVGSTGCWYWLLKQHTDSWFVQLTSSSRLGNFTPFRDQAGDRRNLFLKSKKSFQFMLLFVGHLKILILVVLDLKITKCIPFIFVPVKSDIHLY